MAKTYAEYKAIFQDLADPSKIHTPELLNDTLKEFYTDLQAGGTTPDNPLYKAAVADPDFRTAWTQAQTKYPTAHLPALPPVPTPPAPPPAPSVPPGPNPLVPPVPPPLTDTQTHARATLMQTLNQYGLGSLADWAWGQYLNQLPIDQIMLDMRQRPEYKMRFPAMEDLAQKGRAITETEYIAHERETVSLISHYLGPTGVATYATPELLSKYIAGEVSPSEIENRLKLAQTAAITAPEEVRGQLQTLYGIDHQHLTSYWVDPDKSLATLQQQYAAGELGGVAQRSGFNQLTRQQAERLAQLGITQAQGEKGFGDLMHQQQLMQGLAGAQGQPQIGQEQQLGAAFGNDQATRDLLEQVAAQRKAAEAGQYQYLAEQRTAGGQGVTGVGAAERT